MLGHARFFAATWWRSSARATPPRSGANSRTRLATELGAAGLVIVSGLARGIDTAAHEGSLATGTVAVVAGGIDIIYPPENAGALRAHHKRRRASFPKCRSAQSPQARHFPRRNRIISGLARGVVVVEAAEGSGSLITANYALEQGREIFAVPGSPLDPRAKGANRLIRDGATLTETARGCAGRLAPDPRQRLPRNRRATLISSPDAAAIEAEADRSSRDGSKNCWAPRPSKWTN